MEEPQITQMKNPILNPCDLWLQAVSPAEAPWPLSVSVE